MPRSPGVERPGSPAEPGALRGQLVLLLYDSRSGSTLLSRLLDEYADIGVTIESDLMLSLLRVRREFQRGADVRELLDRALPLGRIRNLEVDADAFCERMAGSPPTFEAVATTMLGMVFERDKPSARVWMVKDGANGYHVSRLARELPSARFIHILRDGRAVLNSKLKTLRPYGEGENMARDALTAARLWTSLNHRVDRFAARHPRRVLEVRFEDLVADSEAVTGEIRAFLGLPDSAPRGNHREGGYSHKITERERGIHALVDRAPQGSRGEAWRSELPRVDRQLFEYASGDVLRAKGYPDVETVTAGDIARDGALRRRFVSCLRLRGLSWISFLVQPEALGRAIRNKLLAYRNRR